MPENWEALLREVDRLIRDGKGRDARSLLRRTAPAAIPRRGRAAIAQLAARAGLAQQGVRLLGPVVRPERKIATEPTDAEKAEYAHCLMKLGALDEAGELLASVDARRYAPALFYAALTRIHRWDYEGAIPLLERYVRGPGVTPYQKLVGKVNLAAAVVGERRFRDGSYLLRELVYETGVQKLWLLHGNVLQFAACNCLFQGRFEEARKFLDQASERLRETEHIDEFFVRKWRAIVDYVEGKPGRTERAALAKVREEAVTRRHWETVRDCDRFRCVKDGDERLFAFLYQGTPYPGFRKWLVAEFPRKVEPPGLFVWSPAGGSPAGIVLDVASGQTPGGQALVRGASLHRLLTVLASDFYRPFRLMSLFERVFPGQCYRPATSLPRVHQAIRLLRQWLDDKRLPLTVAVEAGEYRLTASQPCGVLVAAGLRPRDAVTTRLDRLREKWPAGLFSTEEARGALSVSYRTAHRVLESALVKGEIERIGKTSHARYRFKKAS